MMDEMTIQEQLAAAGYPLEEILVTDKHYGLVATLLIRNETLTTDRAALHARVVALEGERDGWRELVSRIYSAPSLDMGDVTEVGTETYAAWVADVERWDAAPTSAAPAAERGDDDAT